MPATTEELRALRLTLPQKRVLERATEVRWNVPYGVWTWNGRRLSRPTCERLERRGLIQRGKSLGSSIYLCALTDAGRALLSQSKGASHDG